MGWVGLLFASGLQPWPAHMGTLKAKPFTLHSAHVQLGIDTGKLPQGFALVVENLQKHGIL